MHGVQLTISPTPGIKPTMKSNPKRILVPGMRNRLSMSSAMRSIHTRSLSIGWGVRLTALLFFVKKSGSRYDLPVGL